jgi:predicted nucleic acid-binding protein
MAFLLDTDAISEVFKKKPAPAYLSWLATIPKAEQFTSAISVGELFRGAFRSADPEHTWQTPVRRLRMEISRLPRRPSTIAWN